MGALYHKFAILQAQNCTATVITPFFAGNSGGALRFLQANYANFFAGRHWKGHLFVQCHHPFPVFESYFTAFLQNVSSRRKNVFLGWMLLQKAPLPGEIFTAGRGAQNPHSCSISRLISALSAPWYSFPSQRRCGPLPHRRIQPVRFTSTPSGAMDWA